MTVLSLDRHYIAITGDFQSRFSAENIHAGRRDLNRVGCNLGQQRLASPGSWRKGEIQLNPLSLENIEAALPTISVAPSRFRLLTTALPPPLPAAPAFHAPREELHPPTIVSIVLVKHRNNRPWMFSFRTDKLIHPAIAPAWKRIGGPSDKATNFLTVCSFFLFLEIGTFQTENSNEYK